MTYNKTTWQDLPSTATAISATNLNKIETGVDEAHTHMAATAGVHGISNTANLVYTSDSRLSDQRVPTDDSVSTAKISNLAVTTAKIADGAVTSAKIASGAITGTQTFNTQTGTTYTLVLSDADFNKTVTLSNASAIALSIPLNSSVAFPIGSVVNILQLGAGQVTVSGISGVTLNSEGAKYKTKAQFAVATLLKTATDTWVMFGNVAV